jgi:GNAT superfamily N-acetyltransferase
MPVLRAVEDSDRPFLLALFAETRAAELMLLHGSDEQRRALVEMQFRAQDADYRSRYPDASFDVVLRDGVPVGRLYVDRRPDAIHVLDIAVELRSRGQGIARSLFRALLDEAAATGRKVTLYAEPGSVACAWYRRLGFVPVNDGGAWPHVLLEWAAG